MHNRKHFNVFNYTAKRPPQTSGRLDSSLFLTQVRLSVIFHYSVLWSNIDDDIDNDDDDTEVFLCESPKIDRFDIHRPLRFKNKPNADCVPRPSQLHLVTNSVLKAWPKNYEFTALCAICGTDFSDCLAPHPLPNSTAWWFKPHFIHFALRWWDQNPKPKSIEFNILMLTHFRRWVAFICNTDSVCGGGHAGNGAQVAFPVGEVELIHCRFGFSLGCAVRFETAIKTC